METSGEQAKTNERSENEIVIFIYADEQRDRIIRHSIRLVSTTAGEVRSYERIDKLLTVPEVLRQPNKNNFMGILTLQ